MGVIGDQRKAISQVLVWICCVSVLVSAVRAEALFQALPPAWVEFSAQCRIKAAKVPSTTRVERFSRDAYGSTRRLVQGAEPGSAEVTIRNARVHITYVKAAAGEWLGAPILGTARPPVETDYVRSGVTATPTQYAGFAALMLAKENDPVRQIVIPELNFFPAQQAGPDTLINCGPIAVGKQPPEDFLPPPGVLPRMFLTLSELNAFLKTKR